MSDKKYNEQLNLSEQYKKEFDLDTDIVSSQTCKYLSVMQPSYILSEDSINGLVYGNSSELLEAISFFRVKSCSVENVEEIHSYLNNKMIKFYTAIHAINKPIIYGIIAYDGITNLVIGIYAEQEEVEVIKNIMQGLLSGVDFEPFSPKYSARVNKDIHAGFISGVPSIKVGEEKQNFDISSVMRSLNGQNYTLLFISRPVSEDKVSRVYEDVIQISDSCFEVSKRNLSRQFGKSYSIGGTDGISETNSHSSSTTKTTGRSTGFSVFLNSNQNWSKSKTESDSESITKNFSKTITDTINSSSGESHDVQNGFALEIMKYADKSIERLRQGKSNGMWETLISYSTESTITKKMLEACINGEISKPNSDLLPVVIRSTKEGVSHKNPLLLPKILKGEGDCSPLCTMITSEELGFMSTPPSVAVPNFEVRIEKNYPLTSDDSGEIHIGNLNDGTRSLENMPFTLSHADLARHTFICGITGSGKTTTVKRILDQANKPFLVIESAKTEYRSMGMPKGEKLSVYTLGRPEINCISFNPFYIQNGVSPQTHIDLLKDLFNASFSFYGPMPYILEKCLHNIYKDKGWNLTLGYHPYLANTGNIEDFFDSDFVNEKYNMSAHKYLCPTMQDLKDEVERYIEKEMNYEGEIAGNIKTAIKTRLDSLCTGAKGYMFNTHDFLDMNQLMQEKAVLELEGLADDTDKAFAVGLMIIFVNEYRQIYGRCNTKESPLSHLLVIEEAHRLLKNSATEKISEDTGNPKGKAVEHFTNMIAEMRSYGQGVIIAEQIPTKLAPDVIKNSSNKIVQRLVAIDDQMVIANTIGINSEDSIQLGVLCTGKALCHKEGMSKPVRVDIIPTTDRKVTDTMLYTKSLEDRIQRINLSILNEALGNSKIELTIQLLNSILIQSSKYIKESLSIYKQEIKKSYLNNGIPFIGGGYETKLLSMVISAAIERCLLSGTYKVKELLSNEFEEELINAIQYPSEDNIFKIRKYLKDAYGDDPGYKGKYIIAMLMINQYENGMDIKRMLRNYFICPDDSSISEIIRIIKGE